MLVTLIRYILDWAINAYLFILIARMILDWVFVLSPRWYPKAFVATLVSIVYRLTDPPLRWLRRYIKPLSLGAIQLDLSFMVLYFILIVLQVLI
ncbi:YggT family protein [Bifidobacterium psychraerophilum]|jgi:YggT family protein|uniref:Hemolysin-like protein n=1 Tax=Bifidobacterium psychraerophilum TaxID=218140 RepID=A0A087CE61_9BIFI|nr:YggT family protein [Bifidobacterium psychraerophilum]KFI81561.1 hemolysin-like protein [Bifidobacterium psychraerophilum]MCI1660177.1 YggT family protein [Bifidobacterium psychraerophilum]MCI1804294.1 YggT family protein [Bifidobacterium psychraerophilum]MCI2176741.1 YggT family protein [Bifidobacterium psychraerophilum]MCI2181448.1 YggT family protein [Bifidobacterium psychraerophilum]